MEERSNQVGLAMQRVRAVVQRLRQSIWRGLRQGIQRFRALADSPSGRKTVAVSAVGLALLLALAVAGIPGRSPTNDQAALESTGKELFEAIMEQNPTLRLSSRVADSTESGSASNLLVLPHTIWNELEVDQRNSLGSWLNTLGRRWNIQVGALSEDGSRVLDPKPVITSREWNRQVK